MSLCLSVCLYTHAEDSRAGLGVAHGSCYAPSPTSLNGGLQSATNRIEIVREAAKLTIFAFLFGGTVAQSGELDDADKR